MKLSFQIPIPLMPRFLHLEDFHFALTHLILDNSEYSRMLRNAAGNTLLDNGVHETGIPATYADITEAARTVHATHIIPPDFFHDTERTFRAFDMALYLTPPRRLWPVVQAKDYNEAFNLYNAYMRRGVFTVCFPYRAPWREQFFRDKMYNMRMGHHMLSLNSLSELEWMKHVPNVSLDTGKPFRLAQAGLHWDEAPTEWRTSVPKLDMHSDANPEIALDNMEALRERALS
jgi:hypothetical protein